VALLSVLLIHRASLPPGTWKIRSSAQWTGAHCPGIENAHPAAHESAGRFQERKHVGRDYDEPGRKTNLMGPALVDLKNVRVIRGDNVALDDFSMRVEAGEHVAILGPNGCG